MGVEFLLNEFAQAFHPDATTTQRGARTGTVDLKTGKIYLPAAEYVMPTAGQRPEPKPGTFQILVLDRPTASKAK